LIKSTYDIGKVLVTGDDTLQRQAAQGFGRSVIGTSIIGAGAYLASQNLMTGDPKDDAEKAQWEAQGIKPNSVKIGDRWYGLQSVGPQFVLALAGAQMVADKENGDNPYTKLAANIGNNFSEQTFIKGMSSFVDAIKEPERNLDFYVQSQATSVIPNIVKDIARAVDPNERQTNNVWDKFQGSIPGASKSLPERKDSYGQTIKNSGALEIVDLFNSSKEKDVPEATYIDALRNSTGEKNHVPTKAARTVQINGESKKLNSQEYSDYQNYIGNMGKQVIGKLKDDPAFRALPDTEQVKRIDTALQDINSAAKIKLFGNNPTSQNSNVKRMVNGEYPKINTSITTTGTYAKTYKEQYQTALEKYNDPNNGWSDVEKTLRKKSLDRLSIKKDYDEDVVDLYSMSKADMYDYVSKAKNGDALGKKLLAYDKALYDAGLSQYMKYRNGLAPASRGRSGRSGGKGGRKGAKRSVGSYKMFAFGTPATSLNKSLRALLDEATLS
jgi:hypothetical protein